MERRSSGRFSFGVTGGRRPWLADLAGSLEAAGYAAVWTNDTRQRSGIAALSALASGSARIELGLGVAALSERSPKVIADDVERSALPLDRLVLGVGSGGSRSLQLVRDGVSRLRELLPGRRLAVAAVGPRMCRLAGEIADVVLLNWATPDRLESARRHVADGAADAGRVAPVMAAYVRVAIGDGARERLEREAARYAAMAAWYARILGDETAPVGVAIEESRGIRERLAVALAPYRTVLDETVVRGLPASDDLDEWSRIAEAAAP